MNRRQMIKGSVITGAAIGIGGPTVLLQTACAPKNLSLYVQTVVGSLQELSPLLPSSAQLIAKAVKIANDFDAAYKAGRFTDATTLFTNLSDLLSQITGDAGVNSPTIKIALAVAGIAMRAIAVLLKSQSTQPAVATAIKGNTSAAARQQMSLINNLANDAAVNQIFQAVRF